MLLHLAPLAMLKGGCVTLDPRTQRKCSRRIDRGGRLSPVACVQQRLPRRSSSPLRDIAAASAGGNWHARCKVLTRSHRVSHDTFPALRCCAPAMLTGFCLAAAA
jgi:hypothetical protein